MFDRNLGDDDEELTENYKNYFEDSQKSKLIQKRFKNLYRHLLMYLMSLGIFT